jgi:hypothetical protein
MATYREIQDWVKAEHGYVVKTCWIAHCKEIAGLPLKISHRRYVSNIRQVPCPTEKKQAIMDAFNHFGMVAS